MTILGKDLGFWLLVAMLVALPFWMRCYGKSVDREHAARRDREKAQELAFRQQIIDQIGSIYEEAALVAEAYADDTGTPQKIAADIRSTRRGVVRDAAKLSD